MYDDHFGHLISEAISRIPQSLAEHPDLPLYFTCGRPTEAARTSRVFQSIMKWLNVPLEQLRFIHQPTLFRELHIAAQAEHLNGPPTALGYLDLLEARIHGNLQKTRPSGITFVSRCKLAQPKGSHAAEGYLVDRLEQLGVRVIHPQDLPLPDQMQIYADSKHLVFSEGSAIHGRQLMGYVDQEITILRRRFRSSVAQHQLRPRCETLTYVPCFAGALYTRERDGAKIHHMMSSIYRIAPVFKYFEGIGVDLTSVWNHADYERARDHDVLAWVRALYSPSAAHWLRPTNTAEELLDQLEPLELEHLKPEIRQIIAASPHKPKVPPPSQPGPSTQPPLPEIAPYVVQRGAAGLSVFRKSDQQPTSFQLVAVADLPVTAASVTLLDTSHDKSAEDIARLCTMALSDQGLGASLSLMDTNALTPATDMDCARMALYLDFARARAQAQFETRKALTQINQVLAAVQSDPDRLITLIDTVTTYDLRAQAGKLAQSCAKVLVRQRLIQWVPNTHRGRLRTALERLAETCARAGQAEQAGACQDAAKHLKT